METAHLGILIGRFEPLHLGHHHLITDALKQCDLLLIVIGSAFRARNFKNPWTFEERKTLIELNFPTAPLQFAPIPDFFYSEHAWVNAVKAGVANFQARKITLFGHQKDSSSYYLQEFPNWHYIELPNFAAINATRIREEYFWEGHISENVSFITRDFMQRFKAMTEYKNLQEEALFVKRYKESWSQTPYPPIFVTTDAIVTAENHVLVIKRKHQPGKGLYALPGGFLEANEWIKIGLIRELIEETQIECSPETLLQHLKTIQVFDYPDRSLIGRVITHAGHFDLPFPRPKITANDDALAVEWLPLEKLQELRDQFHDDHYQIITTLLGLGL